MVFHMEGLTLHNKNCGKAQVSVTQKSTSPDMDHGSNSFSLPEIIEHGENGRSLNESP